MWLQESNQAGSVGPPIPEGFLLVPTEISTKLLAAYQATKYRVDCAPEAFCLRVDQFSAPLANLFRELRCGCAAFIRRAILTVNPAPHTPTARHMSAFDKTQSCGRGGMPFLV